MNLTENCAFILDDRLRTLPDYDELVASVRAGVDELLDSAPSDSQISMVLYRVGDSYKANFHLASQDLTCDLETRARSPWVAADEAIFEVKEKIHLWSCNKQF